ncbi:MAG TPA: universal stress protein [Terriglobales bacterium]|jgi:nucleotide-binding universal stress UspA family protein
MVPISRILAPVDFSDRCLGMMPYVRLIAELYGAEVILFHVVDPVYVIQQIHRRLCEGHTDVVPEIQVSKPLRVPQWILTERVKQLEGFAACELQNLPVRCLVYDGDPETQIAAFVQSEDVQLIVMPTHGYGVLRRYLIGSVTSKVLHDVSCPVLTGVHLEEQVPLRRKRLSVIVCAVDLRSHSRDTLAWASRFAHDLRARLSIVHVVPSVTPGLHASLSSKVRLESEEMARKDVEKVQKQAGAASVEVRIREGDVAREVCSFAQSIGADLLVIGRSASDHEIGRLRTNAYAIIRQAACPVLSV